MGNGVPPRALTVVLALAFAAVTGTAVHQAVRLQSELEREEVDRATAELGGLVSSWERALDERVAGWLLDLTDAAMTGEPRTDGLLDAAAARAVASRERHYRAASGVVEAFYLWPRGRSSADLAWPPPVLEEDLTTLLQDPCLRKAADATARTGEVEAARAWLGCYHTDDAIGLLAASRAADLLLDAGQPAQAFDALSRVHLPWHFPLAQAPTLGLSAHRVLARRLAAADALGRMGDQHRQRLFLTQVGRELAEMDGAHLDLLLQFLEFPVLADLRTLGAKDDVARLEPRLAEARRRRAGWRYRAALDPAGQAGGAALDDDLDRVEPVYLLVRDPAGLVLLAWAPLPGTPFGGAVQLNPDPLMDDLLARARTGLGDRLVVLDADGRSMRGVPLSAGLEPAIQVPFRTAPDLRLALAGGVGGLVEKRTRRLVVQLLPVAAALLLGGLALGGILRAERRERALYDRQREFVARVTHELKTPLAGIRVMAETLDMGAGEDAKRRADFLGRIVREVERLTERIDEILQVARERVVQDRQPVRIDELATEVAIAWEPRFAAVGATLATEITECPDVSGDRRFLADAIGNLVSNALKYRREDRPGHCVVRARSDDRWVEVEVEDDGIGVPPDMRRRIFEPFQRVEGPGRGKAGGHGLGLAFVADAARKHGGEVECEEGAQGGARFVLRLPKPDKGSHA